MPYFIYRLFPPQGLEPLDIKPDYRAAKQKVRDLRATLAVGNEMSVRMIFAPNVEEAEKLLLAPRETRVIGED